MFRILFISCCMFAIMPMTYAEEAQSTAAPKAATPQAAAPAAEEENPDAMQHMVKAPDIDIANIRDPFASYLSLLAKRGKVLLEKQRLRLANRERELLENFDLSTLKLVGIYTMGEDRVAMIEDSTGKGHVVRRGNYMGKNNGRIEKIDFDTVYLVEQVMNPAGEIVDNQVTLTMKEVND